MRYSKFLVLLTPIFLAFLFEILLNKAQWFYGILILSVLALILTALIFFKESGVKKEDLFYFILPIIFSLSLLSYITISSRATAHILIFFNTIFIYFLLRNFFYYFFEIKKGLKFDNFFSYGNLLAIFFVSSSFYGIKYFLNFPTWFIILCLLPVFFLILYSVIWANKINIKEGLVFILIGVIVLIEIFWTISFLPFNYNTLGLIFSICYYVYIGVVRFFLRAGESNSRTIKLYLIFGFVSILLIILTSKA